MSTPAQLLHVMKKDLMEVRWMLLAYVALMVLATAHALRWAPVAGSPFGFTMVVEGLVGLLIVATAVQADSPTRADAFWLSKPLNPYAVAAAKASLAVLLIALPLVGQLLVVRSYGVQGTHALALTATPVAFYALLLLAALAVACLTADLRAFLLALIVIPITIAIAAVMTNSSARLTPWARNASILLAIGCAVFLILWMYGVRDRRRAARWLGLLTVVLVFLSLGDAGNGGVPAERTRLALSTPDSGFFIEAGPLGDDANVALGAPSLRSGELMELWNPKLVARLHDGRTLSLPTRENQTWFSGSGRSGGMIRLGETPPWLPVADSPTDQRRSGRIRQIVSAPLTEAQRRALEGGVTELALVGEVVVSSARERWRRPLAAGRTLVRPGRRVSIDSLASSARYLAFRMQSESIDGSDEARGMFGAAGERLIVMNRAFDDGVSVRNEAGSGGIDGAVIPGATVSTYRYHYARDGGRSAAATMGDAWLATSVLVAYDYQPVRRYPLRLTLTGDALIPKPPVQRMRKPARPTPIALSR